MVANADLNWTAGSGATSHDVYFGTTSPGTFQGNQAGTTFDPGVLANNTTYFWRIDEVNAGGTTTGNVWSFTTVATAPIPVGEGIKLSKNADFSTDDSVFYFWETMYILVWSDQLDYNNIKEARWQLEGAEEPFTNNFDGTYTSQVLIDDNVKQIDPGEVVDSKVQIQVEDDPPGNQLQIEVEITLVGPP